MITRSGFCSSILLSLFLVISLHGFTATPVLEIGTFDSPTVFNDKKVVLIQKGDDPAYGDPAYDDSGWTIVSLPSEWSTVFPGHNGICWYRIHFVLPDGVPASGFGVSLGTIVDADEVFLNGHRIGRSGSIEGKVSAYDKRRIYELNARFLLPGGDNVLAIRVRGLFEYMNGPYFGDMKFDSIVRLYRDFFLREIVDYTFVMIYLVVSLYFFLFFAGWRKDKENLMFALFCLGMGTYFLLRTQLKYLLDFSFFHCKKVEYLILVWLVLIMTEFLARYFKKRYHAARIVYFSITSALFLVLFFSNDFVFWDNLNRFVMMPSWSIGLGICFAVLVSRLKEDQAARTLFFSLFILFGTLVNDVLVNSLVYRFYWLSQYGFFFFVGGIANILSVRFFRLHKEVADLNRTLEQKVALRTEELASTVADLEHAKAETDNILRNVREGIFLLDSDLRIGQNYSLVMEGIFERSDMGGTYFLELLAPIMSEKDCAHAEDFLRLLVSHVITEKRLTRLNPLDDATVYIKRNDAATVKHLNFAFRRISGKDGSLCILGIVRDVSENKRLDRRIKETEARAESDMRLLLAIIRLNPVLVREFITETEDEITQITGILESAGFKPDVRALLRDVYISVHSIKGNASMLGVTLVSDKAHMIEERLVEIFSRSSIAPVDLIGLPYEIQNLIDALASVKGLIEVISGFARSESLPAGKSCLADGLIMLVERVSLRAHKKVVIDVTGFEVTEQARIDMYTLKKVLIQLVKNAVIHGIELPRERTRKGKSETGRIEVGFRFEDDELVVSVRDDGKGIDIDALKKAASRIGHPNGKELDRMNDELIACLVFEPGITTEVRSGIDSGRGIGLDLVQTGVHRLGGVVSLEFEKDLFTRFSFRIPNIKHGGKLI